MKTNKEMVLASDALSSDGQMIAESLMKENGLSIEGLFNLLGQLQADIEMIERYLRQIDCAIDQAQHDIDCHISNHD